MDLIQNYNQLLAKFESLVGDGFPKSRQQFDLTRIKTLLTAIGQPQANLKIIQVGGTSGKGSTAVFIESILRNYGYKTGLFTSPYLQVLNEFCQINACPVKTTELLAAYSQIEPLLDKNSYFEVKFAICLHIFQQHQIDVAIVEVGLGGKLDATNILDAQVAVLVSVGLDHTEILGDTVELIATDKVHIIKPAATAICGFKPSSTRDIAIARAKAVKANLILLERDFNYNYQAGKLNIHSPIADYRDLELGLSGEFQAHNASCAVLACEAFMQQPLDLTKIKLGLQQASIPGRLEIMQQQPLVLLDGAHNADKLTALVDYISQFNQEIILIIALKQGKQHNLDILNPLNKLKFKSIIATEFTPKGIWTAVPAAVLAKMLALQSSIKITAEASAMTALNLALNQAEAQDIIIITGSLFLVGDCREYWQPTAQLLEYIEQGCND
jgi:dihydrofolate synthase / folylpolyglutamate synthase